MQESRSILIIKPAIVRSRVNITNCTTSSRDIEFRVYFISHNRGTTQPAAYLLQPNGWISPLALSDTNFTWGKLAGGEFCDQISEAYKEVVHWKKKKSFYDPLWERW